MEWHIDPRNPGEVFACAGFAHLAWRADPKQKTGFESNDRFRFVTSDLSAVLDRLAEASLEETEDGLRFAGVELDWWREWGLNPGLKNWAGQQSALTVHESLLRAAEGSRPADWLTHAAPTTRPTQSRHRRDLERSAYGLELERTSRGQDGLSALGRTPSFDRTPSLSRRRP